MRIWTILQNSMVVPSTHRPFKSYFYIFFVNSLEVPNEGY